MYVSCSATMPAHFTKISCWNAIELNLRESTVTKRRLPEIMRENNRAQPPALLWRIKRDVRAACTQPRLRERTSCGTVDTTDSNRSRLFD